MKTKFATSRFALCLFMLLSGSLFAQKTIDFAKYNSIEKTTALLNSKETPSDFAFGTYKSFEKGFWNGIPIEEVVVIENGIRFTIPKSSKNATIQMLAHLKDAYKNDLATTNKWFETIYVVNNQTMTLTFTVDGDKESKFTEDTKSRMNIDFKVVNENPLAKISSKLKSNPEGVNYFLTLDFYEVALKVFINGLPVYSTVGKKQYVNDESVYLNKFLINSQTPISIDLIVTPGLDDDGKPYPKLQKDSYFAAFIESENETNSNSEKQTLYSNKGYVTDTIIENGEKIRYSYIGNTKYGSENLKIKHAFHPQLSYRVAGWTNGKDLRNVPDLETQIKHFYDDFGTRILNKDIDKITELLYDMYLEYYTYSYNFGSTKSYDTFDEWESIIANSFKKIAAKKTKLHISNDGKLAYLEPLDKSTNLKIVGKNFVRNIDFYFYIDKDTNELKIIR